MIPSKLGEPRLKNDIIPVASHGSVSSMCLKCILTPSFHVLRVVLIFFCKINFRIDCMRDGFCAIQILIVFK